MILDVSFESYLPIASFALAAGGLAVRIFVPSSPAKQTLLVAVLIFLVLSSGLQWHREWSRTQQVRAVAEEIIKVVGNEKRTYEDVSARLRKPDYQLITAAMDLLIAEERLGSEPATIIDKADKPFRARLYFVRSP